MKVAINWAGNASHPNDRNRSLTTHLLESWLSIEHIAWISVQKDRGDSAEAWGAQGTLLDLGCEIADFTDTAAILASVDLLITVDSAVAHLAGAMGVNTWLLLPENADYRWMRDCTDSPWYPTLRLWRQTTLGDWQTVVDAIALTLYESAAGYVDSTLVQIPC
jgi:hypothetical protein